MDMRRELKGLTWGVCRMGRGRRTGRNLIFKNQTATL